MSLSPEPTPDPRTPDRKGAKGLISKLAHDITQMGPPRPPNLLHNVSSSDLPPIPLPGELIPGVGRRLSRQEAQPVKRLIAELAAEIVGAVHVAPTPTRKPIRPSGEPQTQVDLFKAPTPAAAPATPKPDTSPEPAPSPLTDLESLVDAVVKHVGGRPPEQFLSVLDDRLRKIGYGPVASVPAPEAAPQPPPAKSVEPPVENGVDRQAVLEAMDVAAPAPAAEPVPLDTAMEFPGSTPFTQPLPPADLDAIVRSITPPSDIPLDAADIEATIRSLGSLPGMPALETPAVASTPTTPAAPALSPIDEMLAMASGAAPVPETPAAPRRRLPERVPVIDDSTSELQVPEESVEEIVRELVAQSGDILRVGPAARTPTPEETEAAQKALEPASADSGSPTVGSAPAGEAVAYDPEAAVAAVRRQARAGKPGITAAIGRWIERAAIKALHPLWVAIAFVWGSVRGRVGRVRADLAAEGGIRAEMSRHMDELMHVGTGVIGALWFLAWMASGGVLPLMLAGMFLVPPAFLLGRHRAAVPRRAQA